MPIAHCPLPNPLSFSFLLHSFVLSVRPLDNVSTNMRQTRSYDDDRDKPTTGGGATTAMRVIVPLQGVVQGRGGLVLGSVIPCALFYFFQLYLKQRQRSRSQPPPPPPEPSTVELSPRLNRVLSRCLLSPRGSSGPAHVSSRANSIAKQADSPYYAGLNRVSEDPFDELNNPDGIFQLGLAENKVG